MSPIKSEQVIQRTNRSERNTAVEHLLKPISKGYILIRFRKATEDIF